MKKFISLFLTNLILFPFCVTGFAKEYSLKFSSDDFRILVLSDTQDDQYPSADMLNAVELAVKESQPDLIVFTGDFVEDGKIGLFGDKEPFREGVVVKSKGEKLHDETLANIRKTAGDVLSIFEKYGVPFAIVQGNNDYKCGITNSEWLEIYSAYPHSLAHDMSDDANDRIDYNLIIGDESGKPVFNLWLMDSGKGGTNEDQLQWLKERNEAIKRENSGKSVPSILFQHINPPDVGNLFEKCSVSDDGARSTGFMEFYRLNRSIAYGVDTIAYKPCEASAEFRAWKECGNILGAYFGHQHVDGFCGTVDGIELGFNLGLEMEKLGPYGYRIITLHKSDAENYGNDLYLYKGSVKTGNAHYEKYTETGYKEYTSVFEKALNTVKNIFVILDCLIREAIA